jgi:hypothetical protein
MPKAASGKFVVLSEATMQRLLAISGMLSLLCCLEGCAKVSKEKLTLPNQNTEEAKKLLVGKWEEIQDEKPVGFEFMDSDKVTYVNHARQKGAEGGIKLTKSTGTYEVEGEENNTVTMDLKSETGSFRLSYPFTVSENELVLYRSGITHAEVLSKFKRVNEFSLKLKGKE